MPVFTGCPTHLLERKEASHESNCGIPHHYFYCHCLSKCCYDKGAWFQPGSAVIFFKPENSLVWRPAHLLLIFLRIVVLAFLPVFTGQRYRLPQRDALFLFDYHFVMLLCCFCRHVLCYPGFSPTHPLLFPENACFTALKLRSPGIDSGGIPQRGNNFKKL